MSEDITPIVKFDITKVDGNAFNIMGGWVTVARKEKVPESQIRAVIDDCESRDYYHLRRVIEKHSKKG